MSTISPRFVISINLSICFYSLSFLIKKLNNTLSFMFFMRDESIIMLLDCFSPRFILRSILSSLLVNGDLFQIQHHLTIYLPILL